MKNSRRSRFTKPLALAALACAGAVLPFSAQAADILHDWINPAVGDWSNAANWNGGVPVDTGEWDIAAITNGGTAILNTVQPGFNETQVGNNGGVGNLTITNGGNLTVNNWLVIGRTGAGGNTPLSTLIVAGSGILNKTGDGFIVGDGNFCLGQVIVKDNAVVNVTGGWNGIGNGNGGEGWLTLQDNAVYTLAAGRDWNVGDYGSGRGHAFIKDNATLNVANFWIGKADTSFGRVIQTGGAIIGAAGGNEWTIGGNNAGQLDVYGFYDLSAGSLSTPNNFQIGRYGKGVIYQSGGSITASSWTSFGRFPGSIGIMWQTGGSFTHTGTGPQLFVAEEGRGEFTLAGTGVLECNLKLRLGNVGGVGIVNLNGGTAKLPGIEQTGGTGYVNFNGTTVQAKASSISFLGGLMEADVYAGNAIIDTAGFDVTVSQALLAPFGDGVQSIPITEGGAGYLAPPVVQIDASGLGSGATAVAQVNPATGLLTNIVVTGSGSGYGGPPGVTLLGGGPSTPATLGTPTLAAVASGGLIKNGTGTLTLTGANTYSGATVVNAGKLSTSTDASGAGAYTVAGGAGLGVTVMAANAQLNQASLTLGASTLDIDLGSFGNPTFAPLNVTGGLAVNGVVTVSVATGLPQVGQFPLIKYSSRTGSGGFTLGSLPPGVVATIVTNGGGSIDLNITAVAAPRWDGQVNGTWDIGTTANWIEISTSLAATYADGNAVLFNDAAAGTTSVTLGVTVSPAKVTVNNTNLSYSLSGSGKISGATGLTKQGTNSLTLHTANDYTGVTRIEGGTVSVTNLANGGQPSAIGSASSAANNLILAGGALSYSGLAVVIDRGYSVQAANSTIDVQGDLGLSGPVTATAGSGFVKTGPAKLTHLGAGVKELSGGGFPGYRVEAGTVLFDGTGGAQTNHSQNEFWIGNTVDQGASLILSNTTLNVDSWFSVGRGNGTADYLTTATLYNSKLRSGNVSLGWDNGVAGHFARQTLTLNGTSTLTNNSDMNLGESSGATSTILLNDSSILFSDSRVHLGWHTGGVGIMTNANSSIMNVDAWFSIGHEGGNGTLTLKDNSTLRVLWDMNVTDVDTGEGLMTIQDNATVTANNYFVGKGTGSFGTVNQTGGSALGRLVDGNEFQIGFRGTGTWNLSAGSIVAPNHWFIVGRYGTGPGTFNVTGGTVTHGTNDTGRLVRIGEDGAGVLNLSGSGQFISGCNEVTVGWNASGTGEVNLNGGTFQARRIIGGAGISTFNFNGGLLRAGPNANANFMTNLSAANVLAGGAMIDTGTNNLAIAQVLSDGGGNGGLTKQGTGTLSLDGVNSYLGTTTISVGGLGGSGTIAGPVVFAANTTLSPGASIGTLAVNSTVNLAGTTTTLMEVSKSASTSDLVTGVSTITYGGTLVLKNLGGVLAVGDTFNLFDATTYNGSFSSVVSQTPGQTVTWDTSQLTVDGTVKVATAVAAPVTLTSVVSGGNLNLSWPVDQVGWRLEVQTNSLAVGINTNWVTVPGSTGVTSVAVPVVPGNPTVFFRLVFP